MYLAEIKDRLGIVGRLSHRNFEHSLRAVQVTGTQRRQTHVVKDVDVTRIRLEGPGKCCLRSIVPTPLC